VRLLRAIGRGQARRKFEQLGCRGRGTGKYKSISGHGTYQLSLLLLAARNAKGACSQTKAPLGYQEVIKGTGPVHL